MRLSPGASVAVFAKPGHPEAAALARELSDWLERHGFQPRPDGDAGGTDLAIVLGGDGTMLRVAHRLAALDTPILAVNLGRLGFLTETPVAELYGCLEALAAGKGHEQCRAMLRAALWRNGEELERFDAFNEVVVSKGGLARILEIEVSIDGERIGRYRADGLIVATPSGSTAYSLSAGGPILDPRLDAFALTPICPHSLHHRPLVVPGTARLEIELLDAAEPTYLTVDGQTGVPLGVGDRIVCGPSPHAVTLITAMRGSFYDVLRAKLHWG